MKTERLIPEKFSFYFTAPADSLPLMKGLNFDERMLLSLSKQPDGTIRFIIG